MIVENPLLKPLGTQPEGLGQERPTDTILSRMHRVLAQVAGLVVRLLGLFEFHEDVTLVSGVPKTIQHGLRRRPWGCDIVRMDTAAHVVRSREQWTDTYIVLEGKSDTVIAFVLF